ncbi:hypothetical protein P3X46_006383 [Hevea brasiliensis]|uniref:S-protein homolog n=1 Tax=Hevea brasiliensis TaxID=3981 RepID=A0ABQ9MSF3_HEVBR|nr:hypothetical protein P3X46_006383 [Hevea brasiliensis]
MSPFIARSLSLVMVFLLLMSSCEAWFFPKKQTVSITNVLGKGLELTIHCKSKDDDLGTREIPFNGNFSFRFRPNFMDTTLFYCNMTWQGQTHGFDIYIAQRDKDKCPHNNCSWIIKPTGPCMWNEEKQIYNDCFPWDS